MASAKQNLGRRLALGQLECQKSAHSRVGRHPSRWWRMTAMDLAGDQLLHGGEGWGLLQSLPPYDESTVLALGEGLRAAGFDTCLLYTSPSPRDGLLSRMPSS